jgi:hypothetical protein
MTNQPKGLDTKKIINRIPKKIINMIRIASLPLAIFGWIGVATMINGNQESSKQAATAFGYGDLRFSCSRRISKLMKDPDSFKYLESRVIKTGTNGSGWGIVNYSATNSFGGRVQGQATCERTTGGQYVVNVVS